MHKNETPEKAAPRVLKKLTGLKHVYMETCGISGEPQREKHRVVIITYFALINTQSYKHILSDEYEAKWFHPSLIFDYEDMVTKAKHTLCTKVALYPILFELLPEKFMIPQIISLYESVYNIRLDKRIFSRKLLSIGLLIKLEEKDKKTLRKGLFIIDLIWISIKKKSCLFYNLYQVGQKSIVRVLFNLLNALHNSLLTRKIHEQSTKTRKNGCKVLSLK